MKSLKKNYIFVFNVSIKTTTVSILDEDVANDSVALATDAFPGALDIGDLVRGQTGLGIGNIFLLPVDFNLIQKLLNYYSIFMEIVLLVFT